MLPRYLSSDLKLKHLNNFLLISGPCVIENRSVVFRTCEKLKKITDNLKLPFIFKSSYEKANRTSAGSFRGIGIDEALTILQDVRKEFNVPVLTDVHSELDVEIVSGFVDVIQIPAFLSRQSALLEAAGETGKIVNIKKGQFISPEDIKFSAEKVSRTGNEKIFLTERGTTFGYNNLVVDMRGIPVMKKTGYPVIFDATHSVQMPSGNNGITGGTPIFIPVLARAAAGAGADGFFIETHPDPAKALSDSGSMLKLDKIEVLLKQLLSIHKLDLQ
jgi:2-dehydro-3-deoxyphosphooctonate aldolase (KDO 8-P synthase)